MKKKLSFFLVLVLVAAGLFFACGKQSEGSGEAPTYAKEATSTGGNPHNTSTTT